MRTLHLRLVQDRFDPEEQLPLAHLLSLVDQHLLEIAFLQRPELDVLDRVDLAHVIPMYKRIGNERRGGAVAALRMTFVFLVMATTSGQEQQDGDDPKERGASFRTGAA